MEKFDALQVEAVTSGRKSAAVEMKWADLLNIVTPQELYEELQHQKAACSSIIESKERRIREFQTELKNKDEQYVKSKQHVIVRFITVPSALTVHGGMICVF